MIGDNEITVCTKRLLDVENRGVKRGDSIPAKQLARGITRRSIEDIKAARALNITVEQLRGEA